MGKQARKFVSTAKAKKVKTKYKIIPLPKSEQTKINKGSARYKYAIEINGFRFGRAATKKKALEKIAKMKSYKNN